MRPAVYHSVALGALFIATLGLAAAVELRLQTRQGEGRDPSYVWMLLGSFAGVALAFTAAGTGGGLGGPRWVPAVAGIALMWSGFALRIWAVRTLGRFFTVQVAVGGDHALVDTGPYGRIRHPSYAGLLVFYLGLGIALDSYASVGAAVLLPGAAIVNRIVYEERLLRGQFGRAYEVYSSRTSRLLPGLW